MNNPAAKTIWICFLIAIPFLAQTNTISDEQKHYARALAQHDFETAYQYASSIAMQFEQIALDSSLKWYALALDATRHSKQKHLKIHTFSQICATLYGKGTSFFYRIPCNKK